MMKRALLGFHDPHVLENLATLYEVRDFQVDTATTTYGLLRHLREKFYNIILMDPNLGDPGSTNLSPIMAVNDAAGEALRARRARLIALTGHPDVAERARRQGFETYEKGECKIADLTALATDPQRS